MRVTLLAGLVASLAISVSAGGGGGGFGVGDTGKAGPGGQGGGAGVTKGGDAHGGKTGNAGNIENHITDKTGSGGPAKGGEIDVGAPIGPTEVIGNVVGGSVGPVFDASANANAISNIQGQTASNAGAKSSSGSANAKTGPVTGGHGGAGGGGGNTGNGLTGNRAGAGGGAELSASVPAIPARRSLEELDKRDYHLVSRGEAPLTVNDILDAIKHNQKLPAALEEVLPGSVVGREYNIPAGRDPVIKKYADLDCRPAIKMLQQGKIPKSVAAVLDKEWGKKGASPDQHANDKHANDKHPAEQHHATNSHKNVDTKHQEAPKHAVHAGGKRAVPFQG